MILERFSSPHNDVVVRRRRRRIDFDVEGATFATWHPQHRLTGYSWDAITAGCLLHPGHPDTILLLGLAGGTVVRQLRALSTEARVTAVEIDPALVELGRRYMELDAMEMEVVIDDAYAYLARTRRRFDVIADDIYRTGPEDVERPDRPIADVIDRLKNRLAPGGIALANFVTGDRHQALYERARRAFRERFSAVTVVWPPRGYNAILVGGDALRAPAWVRANGERFTDPEDRRLWRSLKARTLRR